MSKDSRRRFATVEALKKFTPERLRDFLFEFPDDVDQEVGLALALEEKSLPYEKLVDFFMNKSGNRSPELLSAIFYINALATPVGKRQIQNQAVREGIQIVVPEKCPVHDYVFFAWMAGKHKDLLAKSFARGSGQRKRGAVTYQTEACSGPKWDAAAFDAGKSCFEAAMDKHFLGDQEGGGTEITPYPEDGDVVAGNGDDGDDGGDNRVQKDDVWLLIQRGGELTRQGVINKNKSRGTVEYTPELYDAAVYCPDVGELRVYAPLKDREVYRQKLGVLIGKSEGFFARSGLLTLDPLMTGKRSAIRLEGFETRIKWVRLVELQWRMPGEEKEYFTHRARDLFELVREADPANGVEGVPLMPAGVFLERADLLIKFHVGDPARIISIIPPEIVRYTRTDDASTLEKWLRARFFKISGGAPQA